MKPCRTATPTSAAKLGVVAFFVAAATLSVCAIKLPVNDEVARTILSSPASLALNSLRRAASGTRIGAEVEKIPGPGFEGRRDKTEQLNSEPRAFAAPNKEDETPTPWATSLTELQKYGTFFGTDPPDHALAPAPVPAQATRAFERSDELDTRKKIELADLEPALAFPAPAPVLPDKESGQNILVREFFLANLSAPGLSSSAAAHDARDETEAFGSHNHKALVIDRISEIPAQWATSFAEKEDTTSDEVFERSLPCAPVRRRLAGEGRGGGEERGADSTSRRESSYYRTIMHA
jgi:hypothetical protein